MAVNKRRQLCATKRKRMVSDRKKKIVDRRHLFFQNVLEGEEALVEFK